MQMRCPSIAVGGINVEADAIAICEAVLAYGTGISSDASIAMSSSFEAFSEQIDLATGNAADGVLTDEEAIALLSGDERAEMLAPLVAEGFTEEQAECVSFVRRSTAGFLNRSTSHCVLPCGRSRARTTRSRWTDVSAVRNALWLNWARYADQADLDRGLDLCDRIALTP
jgi:hypothetical protein